MTILLRQGSSGNLKDVKAITAEGRDGTFTWTPDSDIKEGKTYAFQIWQDDETNYTALLKSAGKPMADVPEAHETAAGTSTTTGGTTSPNVHTTGGSTTAPQPTQATQATQATQPTLTSTGSKALISSSANPSGSPSGSPSSSATASSTETSSVAGTEIVNNKEASSTDSSETGAASTPQIPVQLVMGVVGMLAYLV